MADRFTAQERSDIMSRVKNKDTAPEVAVRRMIHSMGYRFRLHRRDLPGSPDIVLPRHKKVIFVHGCFWHGHPGCPRAARPATNTDFWNDKLDTNIARDAAAREALVAMGWDILVVWQCQLRDPDALHERLRIYLQTPHNASGSD